MSNISPSTFKYFQDIINSVRKQNGKATEKQWRILQRIKTGEFNPSTKNQASKEAFFIFIKIKGYEYILY